MTEEPERQPSVGPVEKVSKLDAARRQLRTALRLFLQESDSVSIHTLAAASHEILRTLIKAKGGGSLIRDSDFIKPEYQKEYEKHINRPRNFFKHADRDPNEVLEFPSGGNVFDLYDCVVMDYKLNGNKFSSRECQLFMSWFMISYPHLLKPGIIDLFPKEVQKMIARKELVPKRRFLDIVDKPDVFPTPNIKGG